MAIPPTGIQDFYASIVHSDRVETHELCTKKSDGTEVCASGDQLAAILAGTAAGAPEVRGVEAPASQPASAQADDMGTTSSSTTANTQPPVITINGANPANITVGDTYADLGALFTHSGQSETIYSSSTVDTTAAGTTTVDYWAQVPDADWLHATRDAVVESAANDNIPAVYPPSRS